MTKVPKHFPELLELAVWYLGADSLQPLRNKALPEWLTDDVVWYQTQYTVQTLFQLCHCAARLVPVASHLRRSMQKEVICPQMLYLTTPIILIIIFSSFLFLTLANSTGLGSRHMTMTSKRTSHTVFSHFVTNCGFSFSTRLPTSSSIM